jgi:hemerythrin
MLRFRFDLRQGHSGANIWNNSGFNYVTLVSGVREMPFIEWEKKYLLGVEQFDLHHKHLVDLLNEAYEMFVSGVVDDIALKKILDALSDYANYHFDLEENWMRQVNYPKLDAHILEHTTFKFKLFELNKQFENDRAYLTLEIVSFLRRWLLDHILNSDAKYGAFMRIRPMLN